MLSQRSIGLVLAATTTNAMYRQEVFLVWDYNEIVISKSIFYENHLKNNLSDIDKPWAFCTYPHILTLCATYEWECLPFDRDEHVDDSGLP